LFSRAASFGFLVGNFLSKPHAICDEWRSRKGEVIDHG